jgi:hypothetical protein
MLTPKYTRQNRKVYLELNGRTASSTMKLFQLSSLNGKIMIRSCTVTDEILIQNFNRKM